MNRLNCCIQKIASIGTNVLNTAVLEVRALVHPEISRKTKIGLLATGIYVSAPIDLIPEWVLGHLGLVDDGVVVITAMNRLLNHEDPEVISELWSGTDDELAETQQVIGRAGDWISSWVHPIAARTLNLVLRIRQPKA